MQADANTVNPSIAHEAGIIHSGKYTEALHQAHYPAMFLSLALAGLGILMAFILYQWKKVSPDKLVDKFRPLYSFSLNKWFVDEFYHATFISGTLSLSQVLAWFDNKVVDGLVNGSAAVTRFISYLSGWFDNNVVDGMVNFTAFFSGFIGLSFKRLQTGKVQTYVVFVIFSVLILLLIFRPF